MFSPFHLVGSNPFPFFLSIVIAALFIFGVKGLHYYTYYYFFLFLFVVIYIIILWVRDIEEESALGFHTDKVSSGLRLGMLLFITSEVLFFFSFFWSYFHNCLCPSVVINTWPPYNCLTYVVDPFSIPLLNTVLLLSSGVRITGCHSVIIRGGDLYLLYFFWFITIFYGILFLDFQLEEYIFTSFSINRRVYGRVFFMLTGFHGFHVILGLFFLLYWFSRVFIFVHFSVEQHVSFEITAWYWHFVDVVWLFLFVVVYWYPS